ncbi:uncharacterized protein LOC130712669 [Lotus japonicus]|uniref:uncharacterized protein LOC130712669 n=1 Tax=Lotus japonicus TaxID=34305 RepID=UPI002586A171|nr:uncharacterized protein LOC130712669 [Lotus japonicus]
MDNVSFHHAEFAQKWKFVFHRRISRERELSEEAMGLQEIMDHLNQAGSTKYKKVFVRGRCVNFSPHAINENLDRSFEVVIEGEPDLHQVACTLTGRLVKKWPKKVLLPSGQLTAKYAVLHKIGAANWMATNHTLEVTPQLAKLIFLVGTGAKLDFGTHVFEQTIKHAESFVVKLLILFPCLLTEMILQQHPNILRADEPQGKKPLPLNFDYHLFARTHGLDIMLSVAKGNASASGSKKVSASIKEDILAELIKISKTLHDTIQASKVRKHNVDKLIRMMSDVPTVEVNEVDEN